MFCWDENVSLETKSANDPHHGTALFSVSFQFQFWIQVCIASCWDVRENECVLSQTNCSVSRESSTALLIQRQDLTAFVSHLELLSRGAKNYPSFESPFPFHFCIHARDVKNKELIFWVKWFLKFHVCIQLKSLLDEIAIVVLQTWKETRVEGIPKERNFTLLCRRLFSSPKRKCSMKIEVQDKESPYNSLSTREVRSAEKLSHKKYWNQKEKETDWTSIQDMKTTMKIRKKYFWTSE